MPADCPPALHRDLENNPRDRDGDDGVGEGEAEGDQNGAQENAEADKPVGPRVIAIGYQRGALQATAGAEHTCAAISLPANPRTPAIPSASRCWGACGLMIFSTAKAPATHALMKIASATPRPA